MNLPLGCSALLSLLVGQAAQASSATIPSRACVAVASLLSRATFRHYPADSHWRGRWRAPDVRSGQAHLYRTVVRQEGVGPPDFAGHYKVVVHGCGAGMTCPLFVDLKTGKVVFLPTLRSIEWDYARADEVERATGIQDTRLVYRRDSRLLVALGTRNETMQLTGATLYEWRGTGPRLIRFVPQRALCAGAGV